MTRRWIVGGVLVLLVLAAAGVAYLLLSLDAIVARTIESEGTRLLGVPVSVGSVEISLREGTGTVRDVRVGNPEGFSSEDAFRLDEVHLALDANSLGSGAIHLPQVRIADPLARVEFTERGSSNVQRILDHVADQPAAPESGKAQSQRFQIDQLEFTGGSVVLARPGEEKTDRLDLPAFTASGISGTSGEIGKKVSQLLLRKVAAVAASGEAQRWVEKELGGAAGEAAGKVIRDLLD